MKYNKLKNIVDSYCYIYNLKNYKKSHLNYTYNIYTFKNNYYILNLQYTIKMYCRFLLLLYQTVYNKKNIIIINLSKKYDNLLKYISYITKITYINNLSSLKNMYNLNLYYKKIQLYYWFTYIYKKFIYNSIYKSFKYIKVIKYILNIYIKLINNLFINIHNFTELNTLVLFYFPDFNKKNEINLVKNLYKYIFILSDTYIPSFNNIRFINYIYLNNNFKTHIYIFKIILISVFKAKYNLNI